MINIIILTLLSFQLVFRRQNLNRRIGKNVTRMFQITSVNTKTREKKLQIKIFPPYISMFFHYIHTILHIHCSSRYTIREYDILQIITFKKHFLVRRPSYNALL